MAPPRLWSKAVLVAKRGRAGALLSGGCSWPLPPLLYEARQSWPRKGWSTKLGCSTPLSQGKAEPIAQRHQAQLGRRPPISWLHTYLHYSHIRAFLTHTIHVHTHTVLPSHSRRHTLPRPPLTPTHAHTHTQSLTHPHAHSITCTHMHIQRTLSHAWARSHFWRGGSTHQALAMSLLLKLSYYKGVGK